MYIKRYDMLIGIIIYEKKYITTRLNMLNKLNATKLQKGHDVRKRIVTPANNYQLSITLKSN